MALKSTVFKARLAIADIDHGYYADHALTLARHPSETDERLMVRLVAFALNAHQLQDVCAGDGQLGFGPGLSDPDEPDVWLRDFTGRTRLWVEVGQPAERPLAKACSKADSVLVYAFDQAAEVWWRGIQTALQPLARLQVYRLAPDSVRALGALVQRNMDCQATVQDGALLLTGGEHTLSIECERWK